MTTPDHSADPPRTDPPEHTAVRTLRDPIRRARAATELLATYQARSLEVARWRREAIQEAADTNDTTYTAIATQLGISKARITQILNGPPSRDHS